MKISFFLSAIFIFVSLAIRSFGQSLWEDLNFPQDINSNITSFAIDGNEIYVGTESLGIFYSSNNGKSWERTDESIYQPVPYPVTAIIILRTGVVYAVAKNLFVSDNKGAKWTRIDYFLRHDLEIKGITKNSLGNIYVNTGKAIYESQDRGDNWTNITDNIGILEIYTFGVSPSDYIYLSIRGEVNGFYRNSRNGWVHLTEGLPPNPKTNEFVFSGDKTVYANINNSIYFSENYGALWNKLERSFERIDHLGADDNGNLIVHFSRKIYVYDKQNDKWIDDIDELDITDANDIKINNNYIIAIKNKAVYKSLIPLYDIIKDFSIKWTITVVDNNNQPIKNTEFDLFRMKGTLSQGLGKITTDYEGKFIVTIKNFAIGDGIKIERIVYTKPAVKLSHGALDNIAYRIKIDNIKFGNLGAWEFDILTLDNLKPTIKLTHSTILFRLLLSIEWDAKPEYMDSLASWIRAMNNYLYDVSDGQMYIEKIAIYDKSINWRRSDVHFYASNMVWPCASIGGIFESEGAHAHLPRKWYGNSIDTRNYNARMDWLATFNDFFWTTIGHELGHYMMSFFDEYVYSDTVAGKKIDASYNYGFMDFQYPNGNEWRSEMSNATRYPNYAYKITLQWYYNSSDCWNDLEKRFENTYDGIFCPIIKPSERSNLGGFSYFRGPNENMQINCDVGSLLDCQIFDYSSNAGDAFITCYYYDSKGNLVPLPEAHIILQKNDKKIYQGLSADNGKLTILGADVGDVGYITYSDQLNFSSYICKFNIYSVSSNQSDKNKSILENQDLILKQIDNPVNMVGTCNFDGTNVIFTNFVEKRQKNELEIEYDLLEGGTKKENLRYSDIKSTYSSTLDNNITEEGILLVKSQDNLDQEFIIPFQYINIPYNRRVNSADGNVVLHLEQATNEIIEKFFIISGNYLPIKSNLPKDAILLGSIHSITSIPGSDVDLRGNNFIHFSLNELKINDFDWNALKICHWNNSRKDWTILDSWFDSVHYEIGAPLTSLGTYALFYIPNPSGIDYNKDQDWNFKIIPNPSNGKGSIMLNIAHSDEIDINLVDIYGRNLINIYKGLANSGINNFNYDFGNICEGVYFICIKTKNNILVEKINIIK